MLDRDTEYLGLHCLKTNSWFKKLEEKTWGLFSVTKICWFLVFKLNNPVSKSCMISNL